MILRGLRTSSRPLYIPRNFDAISHRDAPGSLTFYREPHKCGELCVNKEGNDIMLSQLDRYGLRAIFPLGYSLSSRHPVGEGVVSRR